MRFIFEKFVYWMKGFNKKEQETRKCHRFCVACEYYDSCKKELN